jgi:hypothetical protein
MHRFAFAMAAAVVSLTTLPAFAWDIDGQYLEARTCDVFTGPCFANGEMGIGGKEAVLAWKVREGSWKGVALKGLSVALVLKGDNSLGDTGVFPMAARRIDSVVLVDEQATESQRDALVAFVKDSAPALTANIQKVQPTPMQMETNDDTAISVFKAGDVAEIKTRALKGNDCLCTNETAFYKPLVEVKYPLPAYSVSQSYSGDGLNSTWSMNGSRSSYLGTFRK